MILRYGYRLWIRYEGGTDEVTEAIVIDHVFSYKSGVVFYKDIANEWNKKGNVKDVMALDPSHEPKERDEFKFIP